jgi:hypothetical protein
MPGVLGLRVSECFGNVREDLFERVTGSPRDESEAVGEAATGVAVSAAGVNNVLVDAKAIAGLAAVYWAGHMLSGLLECDSE